MKILLETDTATLENNAYEFEVWNEADSSGSPLSVPTTSRTGSWWSTWTKG